MHTCIHTYIQTSKHTYKHEIIVKLLPDTHASTPPTHTPPVLAQENAAKPPLAIAATQFSTVATQSSAAAPIQETQYVRRVLRESDPPLCLNPTLLCQKRPVLCQESPVFCQNIPVVCQKSPAPCQKSLVV